MSLPYTLYQGDCLEKMKLIPDGSVDMVMCDLPYGTTACKWDSVIPFEPLWDAYRRVCKKNAAIVLTASQPFTSALVMSNLEMFSHELIWDKGRGNEPALAKLRPQKAHETVLVFSPTGKNPNYYPIMEERPEGPIVIAGNYSNGGQGILSGSGVVKKTYTHRYPKSVLNFTNSNQRDKVHPTQKPVALMEYLIKTYTNEGETVLDNTMGSGTTGVACMNINRRFIGIERDDKYFEIARGRIEAAHKSYFENLL
jgi:site-specific DNA-methyltransferase (adenine-specific)